MFKAWSVQGNKLSPAASPATCGQLLTEVRRVEQRRDIRLSEVTSFARASCSTVAC
jgi:hypothetical protein